jgi:DNA invertase Pin-like site-specific DNA recombinase
MTNGTIQTGNSKDGLRPKRAVIFVRVRTTPYDAGREAAQLKAQRRYCEQVARQLGAPVVEVYAAHGGTTDVVVRSLIERMLRVVERQAAGYLIVQSCDRLTRRPDELARIARRLAGAGAELVTTADPAAAFLEQIRLVCLIEATRAGRRIA